MQTRNDYFNVAKEYARAAIKDRRGIKFCKYIRQASKRFFDDLKRAKKKSCGFYFDEEEAFNACDFIEKLPHVEGKWASEDIVLHPSHVFFVVQLFGFRKRDGSRRFTSALLAVARKNAKSTLAAGIILYCMCCENEEGGQLISAATTYDQAAIIFKTAKRMVEKTEDLRDAFGLEVWAKALTRVEIGASFRPIHAKASTQDGLNPSIIALDEIHAHKTADLLNVLTSAAGARDNPLFLYTTTEGYVNPGPWGEIRQFVKNLLKGVFGETADHFLAIFYALDDDDSEFDESKWCKANPLLDVNPKLLAAIRKEAVEAKGMASKLAEFKIKRCNRQASTAGGMIDLTKWEKCGGVVDLEWLSKYPCYAALDLSSTTDLTAWRLVWIVDGILYTWGRAWAPEDSVHHRTERGTTPYSSWVEAGYLKATPGNVIDYLIVESDIREDIERFKPVAIGFDPWNAQELCNRLTDDGYPMVEFIQGPKSYHPAIQALERYYLAGNMRHDGNPILHWCASNVISRRDANLNMAPDKKRSPDKIDDIVALIMAVGMSAVEDDQSDLEAFFGAPITA